MSDSLWPHGLQHTRIPCPSLSITNSQRLLKLMSIELVMPSNHLILCHSLPLLPSIFPSQGLFKWVSSLHQVAKVLEFQLQHQSFSNEYSGLISFRMDWLDLLVVQGTLKRLLQHHSSKASIQKKKSINSSALSFLYSPNLMSIHDYWKNHSLD